MTIRCKFKCVSHRAFIGWQGGLLHEYLFMPVTEGSAENREFYASTPQGKFEVAIVKEASFVLNKEYYIDIQEAD